MNREWGNHTPSWRRAPLLRPPWLRAPCWSTGCSSSGIFFTNYLNSIGWVWSFVWLFFFPRKTFWSVIWSVCLPVSVRVIVRRDRRKEEVDGRGQIPRVTAWHFLLFLLLAWIHTQKCGLQSLLKRAKVVKISCETKNSEIRILILITMGFV